MYRIKLSCFELSPERVFHVSIQKIGCRLFVFVYTGWICTGKAHLLSRVKVYPCISAPISNSTPHYRPPRQPCISPCISNPACPLALAPPRLSPTLHSLVAHPPQSPSHPLLLTQITQSPSHLLLLTQSPAPTHHGTASLMLCCGLSRSETKP
jgi:hypothetical protein